MLQQACKAAFLQEKEKHLKFHDLRHSYAIYLLSLGMSLERVAQSLGNSIQFCQQYYVGFTHY